MSVHYLPAAHLDPRALRRTKPMEPSKYSWPPQDKRRAPILSAPEHPLHPESAVVAAIYAAVALITLGICIGATLAWWALT